MKFGWVYIMVALATASMTVGCEKKLFPEDEPRSQFQRYQQLRGQSPPMVEEDAFGEERPAIRQRLRPMDQ